MLVNLGYVSLFWLEQWGPFHSCFLYILLNYLHVLILLLLFICLVFLFQFLFYIILTTLLVIISFSDIPVSILFTQIADKVQSVCYLLHIIKSY